MTTDDMPAASTSTDHIDVAYVAHLARLHLSGDDVERFQSQLDQIVEYVRQIEDLDVTDVEPTSHAVAVNNVFRPDEAKPGLPHERVMDNAPATIDEHFRVPRIVES